MKYVAICAALTQRSLHVFIQKLPTTIINATILLVVNTAVFGYLFPLLGMSESLVFPMFLGNITAFLMFYGFNLALRIQFDLRKNKFFLYQTTLPVPVFWVFMSYIISFIIETATLMLPMIGIGMLLLGKSVTMSCTSYALLSINLLLGYIFNSIFFLAAGLHYPYEWFMLNMWPRRLSWLMSFGCMFYTFYSMHNLQKYGSYILLLNPYTHIAESLRYAIIGGTAFLPWYITTPAIICFIVLATIFLNYAYTKRMDPA